MWGKKNRRKKMQACSLLSWVFSRGFPFGCFGELQASWGEMNTWSDTKKHQPVFTSLFRNFNRRQSSANCKYSRFCRAVSLEDQGTLYSRHETYDSVLFAGDRSGTYTRTPEAAASPLPLHPSLRLSRLTKFCFLPQLSPRLPPDYSSHQRRQS